VAIEQCLRSDTEMTGIYVETLFQKATEQQYNLDIVKSYFYFAYVSDVEGSYDQAIEYLYKALDIELTKEESEFLSRVYSLRGKLNEQYERNLEALDDFRTSQRIAITFNNDVGKANAIANLGKLHRKTEEYHKALENSKKAYEITKNTGYKDEISRINIIMGLGGAYLKLKQSDSALIYIEKGIERSRYIFDDEGVSYFYIDYGIAYFLKKEYLTAWDYFDKAEEIIKELGNNMRLVEVYYYVAK
jgi:tetratricopeptide (TPR) repeat protein